MSHWCLRRPFSLISLARGTSCGSLTGILARGDLDVHSLDLRHEMLLCDVSLHLERARNEVVLDSAELGPEDELSGLFEAAEFLLNGKLHPINLDSLLKVSVVGTKLTVVECDT